MARSVVITGVSTGIGLAATQVLVARGFHVFGSVRKPADGARLKTELGDGFTPLVFDVTDAPAAQAAAEQVQAALAGATLAGLVNNAGIAVAGPLLYLPVDEFRQQLEVNLTGVVIATQAFAPLLGAGRPAVRDPGRIVNISSVGGRTANPFMAPYNVSKFGLEGLSESLRRELLPFGVDVVVVAPGAVATPIWDKADQVDVARYANTPYAAALERIRAYMLQLGKSGLPPEKIGQVIHHALTAPKPKVRYTVAPDMLQIFLGEHLPKRMLDRIVGKRLGLLPKAD
ncbi:MAG: SDR family NAD(P)-dependent oxidoreductase [Alphaproteobacteria bacterium]|nr:SDR family NAD(P)-dependent oxidoreductase [Alphaproteobacteria bacterium]MBU1513933.1 SDR family NAD(P)-dependent oxidoreductase [Alphaproteobacteria bacterium]MBU2092635.1 SDR family NAD(P)-dependent oxidoreductase [Alphaproteobacteria bacterium]MBU2154244.1 SDR family NAD(P)-dependent oxidoreductase [Alphaproteobacteria bacterium]MBU2309510.1 SDR family NAD(P)-dependent oxidoreductase [Alphaproteobacteria bacterium]